MPRRRICWPGGLSRRAVSVLLMVPLLFGCGSEAVISTGSSPADGMYGFLRGLLGSDVTEAELGSIVVSGCAAYMEGLGREDSFTFNGYMEDFLATSEGGRDQADVDEAVIDACGSYDGNVRRFVGDLGNSLHLGLGELRSLMATACADFEAHRRGPVDSSGPVSYDPVITSVLAAGGIERPALDGLVAAACRDLPAPTTAVPPSVGPHETRVTSAVTETTTPP